MKRFVAVFIVCALAASILMAGSPPPPQSPKSYAKAKQWHNIMDYGAKNDSTSGAATIQAFGLAIAAAGEGGTVYVPPGKFLFDSTLTKITSRLTVVCADGAQLYFPIEAQNDSCRNGLWFDSVSYVTWTGGHIIGDADSLALVANLQFRANGIVVMKCDHVIISDVEVSGFEYGIKVIGNPATGGGQTQRTIIQNCKVHHNQRDNIMISNASYNTIRNCQSYEAGYIDYGSDNTYLSWDLNSGDVGSGISIRQFNFTGIEDTSWYNTIENNDIWNCRGQGILLWRDALTTEDIRHTTITNNRIHDVRYSGINIASAPNTIIDHNIVWDCNRPNNMAGNQYTEATYNNDGIHVELLSDKSLIVANTVFDTKVYDTAAPDEAITYAAIQLGDGSPKADSVTESTTEPAPDSCIVRDNTFYNTKRYQKAVLDSTGTEDWWFTHREIDGYVTGGIADTGVLWRTDVRLYRDGRDNMAIDSFALKNTVLKNNSYMASPYEELARFPIVGTPSSGYIPKLTVSSGDTTITWSADATAAAGSGIDSAAGVAIAQEQIEDNVPGIMDTITTITVPHATLSDSASGGAARAEHADSTTVAAQAWSDTGGNNIAETYLPITSNDTVILNAIRTATSGADSLLFQAYEGGAVYSSMWLEPAPGAYANPVLTGQDGFTIECDTFTGIDGGAVDYVSVQTMLYWGPTISLVYDSAICTEGEAADLIAAAGTGGAFNIHDDSSASFVDNDTILTVAGNKDTTLFAGQNSVFHFDGVIAANEFHALGGGISAFDSVVIGTDGYIRWADTGQFLTLDLWDSIVNRRGDFAGGGGGTGEFVEHDDSSVSWVLIDTPITFRAQAGTTHVEGDNSFFWFHDICKMATTVTDTVGGPNAGVTKMLGSVVIGGNYYPLDSGTNGYQLTTDGAGTLTWGAAGGSGGGISSVEEVMDSLGSTLPIAGTGGTLGYDDGGDSLTLAIDVKVSDSAAASATTADNAASADYADTCGSSAAENVRDKAGTMFNITGVGGSMTYDDGGDSVTLSIDVKVSDSSAASATYADSAGSSNAEAVRDKAGPMFNISGTGATMTYSDAGDSVTIVTDVTQAEVDLKVGLGDTGLVSQLAVGPMDTMHSLIDAWILDDTGDAVLQLQSQKTNGFSSVGLQNDATQWTLRITGTSSDEFQIVNDDGSATVPFKIGLDDKTALIDAYHATTTEADSAYSTLGTVKEYYQKSKALPFTTVYGRKDAWSDSSRVQYHVEYAQDTLALFVDSTWEGTETHYVDVGMFLTNDFDADSITFDYLTNGSIDSVRVMLSKGTGSPFICDSLATTNTTARTSTTLAHVSIAYDANLNVGQGMKLQFYDNLADDNDRVWLFGAKLWGKWR